MSEDAVRSYAGERRFGEGTVARWLARDPVERDQLLELVRKLRLGENQFRDLLDLLEDVAARRGTSLREVLGIDPVREALTGRLGRNEAIKALKLVLRRLRYPQLSRAEEALGALVRSLALPAGVRVEFPENLEGEHVAVTLRARSANELRAEAVALLQAAGRREVEEMFAILEGLP